MRHHVLVGTLAFSLLVLLFLARAVALEQCVKVRITNCHARSVNVAYGPVTLCAETRVAPDEKHRFMETTWDFAPPDALRSDFTASDDISQDDPLHEPDKQDGAVGSSVRSLNGADERVMHSVKMHHLEGGTYEIRSVVYSDESRKKVCGRASARVTIH
jgi:hypothetical protein